MKIKKSQSPFPACKGYYARGFNSVYAKRSGYIEQRMGFRLLKRLSCSGCESCGDQLRENLESYFDCVNIGDVQHGALYRMNFTFHPGSYYDPDDAEFELDWEIVR